MVNSVTQEFDFEDGSEEDSSSDDDFVVNKRKKNKKKNKKAVSKKMVAEDTEVSETDPIEDDRIEEGSEESESDDESAPTRTYIIPAPTPNVPFSAGGVRRVIVIGDRQFLVDYRIAPFVLLLFAHLMVWIAGSVPKYELPHKGYVVLFSIVGMMVSIGGIVLVLLNNTFGKELGPNVPRSCSSITIGRVLTIPLLMFDYIGAMYMTFKVPFDDSNGFFAVWITVYGSVLALDLDAKPMNEPLLGVNPVKGLLAASFTHVVAVIWLLAKEWLLYSLYYYQSSRKTQLLVSLMLAISTLTTVGIVECSKRCKKCAGWVYGVLVLCWIFVVCIVTLQGPFDIDTELWYFSAWLSCYFSIMILAEAAITKESPEVALTPDLRPQVEVTETEMEAY
eukprot:Nitzschia sp. Nitz4//scaffold204_size40132//11140//12513//NITZ4_007540-RA/size40132-snap-gene-0.5-mRNA-1//-1//CDS//3329541467//977//frame0